MTQSVVPDAVNEPAEDGVTPPADSNLTIPAELQPLVDRLIKDRVAREQKKYADYNDLKAAASKWAEVEESQKSEVQKAQEAAQKAIAEADELRATIRQQAVITAAVRANAVNPEQVARLVGDLGDADAAAIDEAVAAFIAENPHMVKADGAPAPVVPAVKGNATPSDKADLTPEAIADMDPRELAKNPELMKAVLAARSSWT